MEGMCIVTYAFVEVSEIVARGVVRGFVGGEIVKLLLIDRHITNE